MGKALRFAAGLAALVFVAAGCRVRPPVDAAEKDLVLRAADLAPFGYGLKDTEPYEVFSKTRFLGTHNITYEFKAPESEKENALYLNVTLALQRNSLEAMYSQSIEKTAITAGLRVAGLAPREVEDFHEYGDTSTFYILEKGGRPVGNVFSMREGRKTYVIVLSGMYFDDAEEWKDLVGEKIEKFSDP